MASHKKLVWALAVVQGANLVSFGATTAVLWNSLLMYDDNDYWQSFVTDFCGRVAKHTSWTVVISRCLFD